jgi:hypothetical protein
MFCKQQVAQLRGVLDDIRARGAELIVIGNGPVHFANAFKSELAFDGPLYTDPSLATYQAAELHRGLLATLSVRSVPKAIGALFGGHLQTRTRGDAFQLGGVVVISKEGELLYRQASEYAGDHPPVEELLRAVG